MFSAILFFLACLSGVYPTIYVTTPLNITTCHGGQPCSVEWIDNGESPLLSNIGPCYVGLYHGHGMLVQQIEAVDVGRAHFLTFTPDSNAGPNSDTYYINFTSINPLFDTSGYYYTQYSPLFTLDNMNGSLSMPIPSDTSSISVPSTIASPPPTQPTSTITVSNTFSSTTTLSSTFTDIPLPLTSAPVSEPTSASPSFTPTTTPSSSLPSTSASSLSGSASTSSITLVPTSVSVTALTVPPSIVSTSGFTTSRAPSVTSTPLNPTAASTSGASDLVSPNFGLVALLGATLVLSML